MEVALAEEVSRRDQELMGRRDCRSPTTADDETAVRAVSAAAPPPPPAVAGGRVCQFCARIHPFVRAQCPAWGKVCRVYGGQNHFAAGTACPRRRPAVSGAASPGAAGGYHTTRQRQKPGADGGRSTGAWRSRSGPPGGPGVAAVEQTPPSGEPSTVGAVLETDMDPSRVHKTLYSDNGEPVRFLVDSGSECNVIGLYIFTVWK